MPQAITITVPDNYPETMLRSRIRQIEDILKKESETSPTGVTMWDAG